MAVMSVRIDERKRKVLKVIASVEGKTMSGLVESLIEEYINKNKDKFSQLLEKENLLEIMQMSEMTFAEWDNEEDEHWEEYL